jgi:hypothetical protein
MNLATGTWWLILALSLAAAPALAGDRVDKNVCAASYVAAQSLRADGHLVAAKGQLSVCAQTGCPASISNDCVRWLAEVGATVGSIAITVQTPPGVAAATVQVKLDGRPLSAAEQATEVMVDPGTHTAEVEAPGCQASPLAVAVAEGQRGKRVALVCAAPEAAPAASGAGREAVATRSSAPLFAAAAVGVIGAGVFSYFALSTKARERDLRSDCAPSCATSEVDSLRHRYVIADIGLIFGAAGLATAGVLLLSAPASGPATSASLGLSLRGPSLSLQGRF